MAATRALLVGRRDHSDAVALIAHHSTSLIEHLAAIEHERWSYWQRYMHSKGVRQADGSLTIPAHLVERWEKQMASHRARTFFFPARSR